MPARCRTGAPYPPLSLRPGRSSRESARPSWCLVCHRCGNSFLERGYQLEEGHNAGGGPLGASHRRTDGSSGGFGGGWQRPRVAAAAAAKMAVWPARPWRPPPGWSPTPFCMRRRCAPARLPRCWTQAEQDICGGGQQQGGGGGGGSNALGGSSSGEGSSRACARNARCGSKAAGSKAAGGARVGCPEGARRNILADGWGCRATSGERHGVRQAACAPLRAPAKGCNIHGNKPL